jgi:hypothetical protein
MSGILLMVCAVAIGLGLSISAGRFLRRIYWTAREDARNERQRI